MEVQPEFHVERQLHQQLILALTLNIRHDGHGGRNCPHSEGDIEANGQSTEPIDAAWRRPNRGKEDPQTAKGGLLEAMAESATQCRGPAGHFPLHGLYTEMVSRTSRDWRNNSEYDFAL